METAKLSQKEYLKKYLCSGDPSKKKKKKKPKVGAKTVVIIDDDIDLNNMRAVEDGEFDILNATEDAPQIVGVVDERGPVDFSDKRRWKIIADDGEGNVAVCSSRNQQRDIEDMNVDSNNVEKVSKKRHEKNDEKNKGKNNDNSSPTRRSRKESDSDLSPVRKSKSNLKKKSKKRRKKKSSSESSTSNSSSSSSSDSLDPGECPKKISKSKKGSKNKRKKKDGKDDSDLDFPRKKSHPIEHISSRKDSDLDLSPPRRKSHPTEQMLPRRGSDSDLSPPRARKGRHSDSDLSPPRKIPKDSSKRYKNDFDLSPPRRPRSDDSKRGRRNDFDLSPPRRSRNELSSNSRRRRDSDSYLSPPRISKRDLQADTRPRRNDNNYKQTDSSKQKRSSRSPRRKPSRWNNEIRSPRRKSASPNSDKRMKKTLDGKTAGLQNAKDLREETISHKQREAELFSKMSAEVSGVGQAAVLRDRKTGRRRDLGAEAAEKREKEKRQEEIDEKYAKWGKGLKQVDDQAEKLKQDLYEMSKPLARYADDVDLDAEQRNILHSEDPMFEYVKSKQIKEGKRQPDVPSYQGSFMPNRFGIKPGHRWDGVDRSTGYEKRWFEARNARTAIQEEAYKWSTADM